MVWPLYRSQRPDHPDEHETSEEMASRFAGQLNEFAARCDLAADCGGPCGWAAVEIETRTDSYIECAVRCQVHTGGRYRDHRARSRVPAADRSRDIEVGSDLFETSWEMAQRFAAQLIASTAGCDLADAEGDACAWFAQECETDRDPFFEVTVRCQTHRGGRLRSRRRPATFDDEEAST